MNKLFEEVESLYKSNSTFRNSIEVSIRGQRVILESDSDDTLELPESPKCDCKTVFSTKRTLQSAKEYIKLGYKVGCLNFASAKTPGGGCNGNANAQEESLCRASSLYYCISDKDCMSKFYLPHRRVSFTTLYNDDCIFTPDVAVIRNDSGDNSVLREKDWYYISFVTCAAPNVGAYKEKLTEADQYNLVRKRLDRIMRVFAVNGIRIVVLGAFGCGVFKCNPSIVSRAMKEVITKYAEYLEVVDIAVPLGKKGHNEVYDSFKRVFGGR